MNTRISVVIVMYNEWCGNSCSCKTITENTTQPDLVLIVDNSVKDMHNEEYCAQQEWLYHSMHGNAGLSKAYNAALDILEDRTDLTVWADDDTVFPEDYFEKLTEHATQKMDAEVFLPIVRTSEFILSPAIYTKRRVVPIQSVDTLQGKALTAINSGLAVRQSVYRDYRYDERIFLDCVDHDFMHWCRMNGKGIYVMRDLTLLQNYFLGSSTSFSARQNRAKILAKDTRVYESKCGKSRLLTEWDLFCRWLMVELSCLKRAVFK